MLFRPAPPRPSPASRGGKAGRWSAHLAQRQRGVEHAVGETPFVVVPAQHFHQPAAVDLVEGSVQRGRARVVVVIDRDQRFFTVAQYALELAFAGVLDHLVDFLDAGVARGDEAQIDHRNVDGGYAHREAVQLAVEFGQHQTHRGGAGLGRDLTHGGRTRATKILVEDIGEHLVVGVGVDGRHQPGVQADLVVDRLDQRGQAVGGAAGIRHHVVAVLENAMVDAVDNGGQVLAGRSRYEHLARPGFQVRRGFFLAVEKAGAFQHHVHAQIGPGQLARVALGQHLDRAAVDQHGVAFDLHLAVELAVGGVVLGQVSVGFRIAQIVDGDDLDIGDAVVFVNRAQHVAANSAIAIDGDFYRHSFLPESRWV